MRCLGVFFNYFFIWRCKNWFLLRFRSFFIFGNFWLHLARCSRKVFWGIFSACYLYLLFCSPNRCYISYSRCKLRALTHNLCLSWHIGMWVSPSCMLVLLRMWCCCSAAVLFSAVRTPLLRPLLLTLLPSPHSTQSRQNLPLPNFPLTSIAKPEWL